MSTLMTQARSRVPRFAESAVERARLTVVPQRMLVRTHAARTPFVALVLAILAGGVVGLLMFNTSMQQSSFTATALQHEVTALTAEEQKLNMELDALRDPQRLASEAKALGMVPPSQPAFVRLGDGKVLGTPAPATGEDAVRIHPMPPAKPAQLRPRPIVVKVPAPVRSAQRDTTTRSGVTSPAERGATGRNGHSTTDRTQQTDQAESGATR
jgi:hypothetical protein